MSLAGNRLYTEPSRSAEWFRPLARWILVVLAALLPFEAPLIALGPLTITTVELVLYLLVFAWGVVGGVQVLGLSGLDPRGTRAARGHGRGAIRPRGGLAAVLRGAVGDPVARAAAAWLAVTAVSALVAPSHHATAVKFALRAISGGLVLFAARDLVRTQVDVRLVASALLLGALLSAVGAIAETAVPPSAALWQIFHDGTFSVSGLPRPSGPFGYPTIAAMYWEAALPLAISMPLTQGARAERRPPTWTAVACSVIGAAVLVVAIFFSATRTALAVSMMTAGATLVVNWRGGPRVRVAAGAVFGFVALLSAVALFSPAASSSPLSMRLRWWQDGNWYRAHYVVDGEPLTVAAGSLNAVPVEVVNTGGLSWPSSGPDAVHLSYHWERTDAQGTHLTFEGRRSKLPVDVPPGGTVRIKAVIQAPEERGHYRLRWDLVREHVTWFSESGNPTEDQRVDVIAKTAGTRASRQQSEVVVDSSLEDWVSSGVPSRPELWGAAVRLWWRHPVLGVGPDNFRNSYATVLPTRSKDAVAYDERVHANSLYFETLADTGVLGLLALALFMAAIARVAVRRARGSGTPLSKALPVAVATFFVHGVLDTFLAFTPTYALMWLLVALMVAEADAQRDRVPTTAASADSRA